MNAYEKRIKILLTNIDLEQFYKIKQDEKLTQQLSILFKNIQFHILHNHIWLLDILYSSIDMKEKPKYMNKIFCGNKYNNFVQIEVCHKFLDFLEKHFHSIFFYKDEKKFNEVLQLNILNILENFLKITRKLKHYYLTDFEKKFLEYSKYRQDYMISKIKKRNNFIMSYYSIFYNGTAKICNNTDVKRLIFEYL